MSEERPAPRRPSLASLLLALVGIVAGLGLIFVAARQDPVTVFGREVSAALPLLLVYIAGMLVGRFGARGR